MGAGGTLLDAGQEFIGIGSLIRRVASMYYFI